MSEPNPARIADSQPEHDVTGDVVHAVGVGPGDTSFLTDRAMTLVEQADVVVGFETVTDCIKDLTGAEILACSYDDQTAVLTQFGRRVADGASGVAVLWGDPNVSGYQFLGRVEKAVDDPVKVIPGVSSVQIAASRARTPLEQATFASLHRRGEVVDDLDRLADAATDGRHLIVIVRPYDWMPQDIAAGLVERGVQSDRPALVLEELTLPDESIEQTTVGGLAATDGKKSYSDRSILVVRTKTNDREHTHGTQR
ncbi:cobalt-precorrin-7 (C(5))-methyltransferase [Halovenus rubra]|uniref:Cobalt-precorrin-7 (C(5))-methyltransferase n=2 Tax=Halovenus rubra TaxID=869890 RepID=A0ABD5X137_9EURY|nr:cobalt-precorrin-7 (C(5))-methyltransferase [Halovenus rubra]